MKQTNINNGILMFLPCEYKQVMKDGMIVQSGKYDELLEAGADFSALVAAHDSSMELVEQGRQVEKTRHSQPAAVIRIPSLHSRSFGKGEKLSVAPEIEAATSKIIQEEERESGQVSWRVYKLYLTEAWGWWGLWAYLDYHWCGKLLIWLVTIGFHMKHQAASRLILPCLLECILP
jgi:hypothetical protein